MLAAMTANLNLVSLTASPAAAPTPANVLPMWSGEFMLKSNTPWAQSRVIKRRHFLLENGQLKLYALPPAHLPACPARMLMRPMSSHVQTSPGPECRGDAGHLHSGRAGRAQSGGAGGLKGGVQAISTAHERVAIAPNVCVPNPNPHPNTRTILNLNLNLGTRGDEHAAISS
ncbi:hypothetical protein T492DRAFT_831461 [Pavlovales sp. CCMP2436]|nr:hypothetical protein T492DRAFT_831461 [Pavlovales sp. CCMP2436]